MEQKQNTNTAISTDCLPSEGGPLKKYKNMLSGYKQIYAKVFADSQTLLLSKDGSKGKKGLEQGDVERISLKNAMI
jgi:hypothetical protein